MLAILALPATAQTIYKCTDASGGTLISNTRIEKNCKAIVSGPESTLPAPKSRPATSGAAANPSPAGFPKVQEDTQKARDGDRRHILEQELAGEQRNLEQARKELAEQEALRTAGDNRQDRILPYKDRVGQHERNIQAIQKELSNLR
ncbi:hypothetical protein AT959_19845 [Dechloromonas denitrificans]|uniref:DUF4124 domain-containing protein n=1 Tax=Dechloromonas denitrificans TaxID=281362 RepID=A0A133XDX7_9RHOO|nr:hypothetical protein AT959_19845 [Dechloromonas denitrificans]